MTSRLLTRAFGVAVLIALVECYGDGRSARAAVLTSGPRRSGRRARGSISRTAPSATARRVTAKATPAPHLRPRPRDFTTGKFKVRTTPNGALPTHQDLVNIIRRGMPYTSMPAWPNLSDEEVSSLAYFLTTFSPDFSKAENVSQARPAPERAESHE